MNSFRIRSGTAPKSPIYVKYLPNRIRRFTKIAKTNKIAPQSDETFYTNRQNNPNCFQIGSDILPKLQKLPKQLPNRIRHFTQIAKLAQIASESDQTFYANRQNNPNSFRIGSDILPKSKKHSLPIGSDTLPKSPKSSK